MESLFWVTLVAETFALVHTRLKKFVESPMEPWYVIEGIGGVVEVIDEWGCVRHDRYEYCARAPVGTRGLIDYRFGDVSERGRRKTGIARTTGRMRTKGYAYGCDDGRRREDLAKFKRLIS
jgi:hypothetical protein